MSGESPRVSYLDRLRQLGRPARLYLLHAAFLLHGAVDMALHDAVATVTRNPAVAVGLDDRGEIAPDKRADLVRVRLVDGMPMARQVWRAGERVA